MVAFELAQIHEKAGTNSEAARWYTAAAGRFRRAQWKLKAEEALTRLGMPIPVAPVETSPTETNAEPAVHLEPIITEYSEVLVSGATGEPDDGQQEEVFEQPTIASASAPAQVAGDVLGHRRKRRGRRGGRGRNKAGRVGVPVAVIPSQPAVTPLSFERAAESHPAPIVRPFVSEQIVSEQISEREPEPVSSFQAAASGSSFQTRARAGDPALSSRMAKLESQLRRLLASSLCSLDQAEDAPAGPGVFLITDTDQTCYYYIEACQTLRVGIGNLLRSGRGSREGANLKEKLAEHLGINEARVGKYLKDHCCVRWLQLDEGAPLLAHFAIAVLRPVSND